jgi:hypothetical protein
MIKVYLVAGCLLSFITLNAQKMVTEDSTIHKWTTAIVNIELRTSPYDIGNIKEDERFDTTRDINAHIERYQKQDEEIQGCSGTAIFIKYKDRHYLLTARHVLEDPLSKTKGSIFRQLIIRENGTATVDNRSLHTSHINLSHHRYYFSSPEVDLAAWEIVPGNLPENNMLKTLLALGYVPITIDDIDSICDLKMNDPIYAFGFPELSLYHQKPFDRTLWHWSSPTVTLPLVSKGIVSNPHTGQHYFYGDIFVYHGNSGGPIVRNNKLIGIVSRADPKMRESKDQKLPGYFEMNILFIKSSEILPLLRKFK